MEKIHTKIILLAFGVLVLAGCEMTTSNNGGGNTRPVGKDLVINEVFTLSPQQYYAFSWIEIMNASDRPISWYGTETPATGFVVGANGTILTTTNSGETWSTIPSGTLADLHGIHFREQANGFAVGDGGTILRTTDVGATWVQQSSKVTDNLSSVLTPLPASGGSNAWVVGDNGDILGTNDNGQTWSPTVEGSGTTQNLHCIDMYTGSTGGIGILYAVGDGGTVLQSTSAGFTWVALPVPAGNRNINFFSVSAYNDSAWIAGTGGRIFVTPDDGKSWIFESTKVALTLRNIFVSRPNVDANYELGVAWAVGDGGVIVKTYDGGRTWEQMSSPTTNRLNSVTFVDSLRGWAFGDNGTIISTINGGLTWSKQISGTTADLYGTFFYPLAFLHSHAYTYVLMMYAQRRHVFYDPIQGFNPGVNPNFDFITSTDTGYVFYDPDPNDYTKGVVSTLMAPLPIAQDTVGQISPGGFVIVNSDSGKFKDHYTLGPGNAEVGNVATGLFQGRNGTWFGLWTLLPSGEIRLLKKTMFVETPKSPYPGIEFDLVDVANSSVEDIDVVRYGNFRMSDRLIDSLKEAFFVPGVPRETGYSFVGGVLLIHFSGTAQGTDFFMYQAKSYSSNIGAGYIPEWWSLARYGNDDIVEPNSESSQQSFYLTNVPIPGWYSQRFK